MFKIITDNGSDIPEDYAREHGIDTINLATIIDGVVYNQGVDLPKEKFYEMLAGGAKPTTSQVNPDQAKTFFEEHIDDADEFLFIGISSGLSGTCQSIITGAAEFMEKHPDKKIEVVDTLTGSLGEMLFIYKAVEMRDAGKSFEETVSFLRENVLHGCLAITVDNLMDLWRGGRVNKTSAVIGTIAAIKPFITVNNEGKLDAGGKIRGRKKSLDHIVDYMEAHLGSYRDMNEIIMIAHGNCPDDAEYLKNQIEERLGFKKFMVNSIGPMIGTHTGPTICLAGYFGETRS
ncbi:MAG: DegV family protein [Lachnospiraceae bacterium]|nr:DegV family protein [Lachnospiraceae bacterium]MBP1585765.1 DegV family protein [Lachnospiraceae bacterium]